MKRFLCLLFSLLCLTLLLNSCARKSPKPPPGRKLLRGTQKPYTINGETYYPIPSADGFREEGIASWYGGIFHGRKTANGETYDMYGKTAAHRILPMNTILLVRNRENNRETVVRVNDRGPFYDDRVIDLSYTSAEELGIIGPGTAEVEIVALEQHQMPPAMAKPGDAKPGSPPPKEEILRPDFNKGNFYVQIGAFAELRNARLEAVRFSVRGRDVVIQQYEASGRGLYRVLVFGGSTLTSAKEYSRVLARSGYADPLVIAR